MAELKVSLGSGYQICGGWLTTDVDSLDITLPRAWANLFEEGSIDRLLAEHVLEHLSEAECRIALAECHRYLKPGGLLRIAVPDGYRPDEAYIDAVSPPVHDHQVLFTVDTLVPLLESVGFSVMPLEYFDAQGEFHTQPWDVADGFIRRSARFDRREKFKYGDMFYTSLIIDAKKGKGE